ncbi:MAG: sigma-54-dependent Fis family transcriptional regulator [Nitrospirae bacterium]|nr:MAG: sigma-54-dependent Fis family transcriptional regulator [Nitrospirota bacterium]
MDKILVVDDERNILKMLKNFLQKAGYDVETARNYEEAISKLQAHQFNLVLSDMRLPGRSGLDLLKYIKLHFPELPVIIITAYGSIENAVKAMKEGATNYLTKPIEIDEMLAIIRHTLINKEAGHKETLTGKHYGIIGTSNAIRDILATIEIISSSRANVLITGESGTGKELVARAIHNASNRKEQPFVAINCAAIPAELIENELFGHEAGAYTGATGLERGKVELAHGGTLFLDEIGEMSLSMQVKLLRFIQEREFYRIGGTEPVKSDCRIIAATNKNLEQEIKEGRFREDLFYRLNVIPIKVPPLRERKEDIPLLVEHFLRKYSEENQKFVKAVDPKALEALVKYSWPGNIRELENTIERAVVFTRTETITLKDLPQKIASVVIEDMAEQEIPAELNDLSKMKLSELERLAVLNALKEENWNQTRAARRLGITRRQLRTKMIKYNLL